MRDLVGGCLCRAIRYELKTEPHFVTNCHCETCRRASGAPFITWVVVRPEHFILTRGQPKIFKSSEHGNRGFCRDCGTSLTFHFDHLTDEIDIAAATLDDPNLVAPMDHVWTGSMLKWLKWDDGLPQLARDHLHEGYPDPKA